MRTTDPHRIADLTAQGRWGHKTLHGLLAVNARVRPNSLAVKDQPNRAELTDQSAGALSWVELNRASDHLARSLQAAGIRADDRIIIQLPNIVELVVVYYALSKMGAIASPVPIQYGAYELQSVRKALGATAMISLSRFRQSELALNARAALNGLPVLAFGEELNLDTTEAKAFVPEVEDDPNRVVTICWTSGTTGTPKGVPRSHNMWLATAGCTADAGKYRAGDALLCPFAVINMSALGGFVFPAALRGCAVILHHPMDPPLFLQQMQDERINFAIAPPAIASIGARKLATRISQTLSTCCAIPSISP